MSGTEGVRKVLRTALAVILVLGLSPLVLLSGVRTAYAGSVDSISGSSDGVNVTLKVPISNIDNEWYDQTNIQVTYADGSTGTLTLLPVTNSGNITMLYDWKGISGGSISMDSSSKTEATATATIPLSTFSSTDFTLSANGKSITSKDLGISASSSSGSGSGSGGSDSGSASASGSSEESTDNQGGSSEDGSGSASESGSSSGNVQGDQSAQSSALAPSTSGTIVVDGDNDDWGSIAALASSDSYVAEWKLVRDTDGNVYFMFDGTAVSQWDYNFQWRGVQIGQNGSNAYIQIANLAAQTGATVEMANNANGNTAAPYVVEVMIPASYFSDTNATITFEGTTVALQDIPVLDGAASEEVNPVYNGIVIDGSFKDWAAVIKYDAWCDNAAHLNCIDQTAVVWDGDMIYVYIHESQGGSAAGAGTHGNGLYALTTDLGHQLLFQLNNDGTVSGVDGATASHIGAQWEVAIPSSALPEYLQSLKFGLYTAADPVDDEVFVNDIVNLDGSTSGGEFSGEITIDGSYGDWAYYPHSIIEYATAGTQSLVEDSEGALYSKDGILYAHVYTTMAAHTDSESGGEFLAAVSVAFNGDRNFKSYPSDGNFYPKFFMVDGDGNITVVNEGTHLDDGTYTFYIADVRSTFDLANTKFEDLPDSEIFGQMMVTIAEGRDEMEFEIDLRKVASYIGSEADDFKIIESQFGRLGQQWISTAGTSTLPFLGIGLGVGVVLCVLGWRHLNRGRGDEVNA